MDRTGPRQPTTPAHALATATAHARHVPAGELCFWIRAEARSRELFPAHDWPHADVMGSAARVELARRGAALGSAAAAELARRRRGR